MGEIDGTELVHWRELPPVQRRAWWDNVWDAAITLSARYRLALRHGWWEDAVQVEALAAFHAWLRLYDTGAYTDPPGKLQLLWELERLRAVLRAGDIAFDPTSDRDAFERHLDALKAPATERTAKDPSPGHRGRVASELSTVTQRLGELRERAHLLQGQHGGSRRGRRREADQANQDLVQLRAAIDDLHRREHELRAELDRNGESSTPG
jgi:hypothetical protein